MELDVHMQNNWLLTNGSRVLGVDRHSGTAIDLKLALLPIKVPLLQIADAR
jgi:hypothetical protein